MDATFSSWQKYHQKVWPRGHNTLNLVLLLFLWFLNFFFFLNYSPFYPLLLWLPSEKEQVSQGYRPNTAQKVNIRQGIYHHIKAEQGSPVGGKVSQEQMGGSERCRTVILHLGAGGAGVGAASVWLVSLLTGVWCPLSQSTLWSCCTSAAWEFF